MLITHLHIVLQILKDPCPQSLFHLLHQQKEKTGTYVYSITVLHVHCTLYSGLVGPSGQSLLWFLQDRAITPPGWDTNALQVHLPSIIFGHTHLYTRVERGIMRVKCHAQEHDTVTPPMA